MIYAHNGDAIVFCGATYHWNGQRSLRPPALNAALDDGTMMFHGPQAQRDMKRTLRERVQSDIHDHRGALDKLMKMIMIEASQS